MKLSVIIPFFNEEGNVRFVIEEATGVLEDLGRPYEILAFDDASCDQTPAILQELSRKFTALKIFTNFENLGQTECLRQGFAQSTGDVVVLIDGDGQNDFRDVPRMLELLDRVDAVFGQRIRRDDPFYKRWASWVGYAVRRIVLGDSVRDTACGLKVLKRSALRHIIPVNRFHVYIPFMLAHAGVLFRAVAVNHRPRIKGQSKYLLLKFYFIPYLRDLYLLWRIKHQKTNSGSNNSRCL